MLTTLGTALNDPFADWKVVSAVEDAPLVHIKTRKLCVLLLEERSSESAAGASDVSATWRRTRKARWIGISQTLMGLGRMVRSGKRNRTTRNPKQLFR